jgi:two-component system, response regulator
MNEQPADILLVEDNPTDLELALHALRKHDLAHRVAVARDGVEALDMIFGACDEQGSGAWLPRLILLDLKLPKMDGLEVLQRIKSDPVARAIPVVVLTTSLEAHDVARSYRLGANSYIVKPVEFAQFVEVMGQVGMYWLKLNQPPML